MRITIKRLLGPCLKFGAKLYFSKPRRYNFKNIKGVVQPGVFYPHLTISTKVLLKQLDLLDLKNMSFLELGSGSGIISVLAAKKGAKVLSTDINTNAIENTIINAKRNQVEIETLESDLFDKIDNQIFDWIVINPPYYPKAPASVEERAWFCGKDFEYFKKLFQQIHAYFGDKSSVWMILSEDCEMDKIANLALEHELNMQQIHYEKVWGEGNSIFQLKSV